jgi:hypothetical protein
MMRTGPATIAREIINCIADGREPSVNELLDVAERILADVQGHASAFAWGSATTDGSARLLSVKAAHVALTVRIRN